jgi:methylated-DNA-[protein]-cysteine S-methyltransferase
MKYTVFKTKWGYFGLAATDNGLVRSWLPAAGREEVKSRILREFPGAQYDTALSKTVQRQISAYFEGTCINFSRDTPIVLDGFSSFASSVLTACRDIRFGQTVSYGRLAEMAGRAGAARAVGGALAKNPLPLIIPCHRVTCANGKIGGFSAAGGRNLKEKLLKHEYQILKGSKSD